MDCGILHRLCHSPFHSCFPGPTKNSDWVDQFRVKFLGSVQVPYHKGNDVLCAAMQKVPAPCVPGVDAQSSSSPGERDTST